MESWLQFSSPTVLDHTNGQEVSFFLFFLSFSLSSSGIGSKISLDYVAADDLELQMFSHSSLVLRLQACATMSSLCGAGY